MNKKMLNEKAQIFNDKMTPGKTNDLEAQEKYKAELEEKDRMAREEILAAREKALQSRKSIDKAIVEFYSTSNYSIFKNKDQIISNFFRRRMGHMSEEYLKDIGL